MLPLLNTVITNLGVIFFEMGKYRLMIYLHYRGKKYIFEVLYDFGTFL